MKVIEVIEELNNGKPVLELASELNMSTKLLKTKFQVFSPALPGP